MGYEEERLSDCLFCKIVEGDIPSDKVLETSAALAFRDINPGAPTHVLVIPKRHVASIHDLETTDADELAAVFEAIRQVAELEGVADGYRVVTNVGATAGQSVFHLHFHVLGGRPLEWPPG
ncbi:MAG: histidine triad family protein [Actinomycetota bacterium]|jgi:histidine triad (HIT) family protein|nr:histidine triad family protein [Actinomycetota bacterium]